MQDEVELSFLPPLFGGFRVHHVIGAVIPDDDFACAVIALGDHALETAVVNGMIFGQHRKTFLGRIQAGAFGNGPGSKHAFHFEAEIVVKPRGVMLLNDEAVAAVFLDFAGGFRRFIEPALPFIFIEAHLN